MAKAKKNSAGDASLEKQIYDLKQLLEISKSLNSVIDFSTLIEAILPHTVPNQILRFFDSNRRLLVEMAPPDARFGWPKRNGFVQPLVDAELLRGLDRFEHVRVRWGTRMAGAEPLSHAQSRRNCFGLDVILRNDV